MKRIDIKTAAKWMAKMVAADGVVTPKERQTLKDFAKEYGLEISSVMRLAYGFAKDVVPEVEIADPNEIKGRRFEEFVVSLLADRSKTQLIAWRGDKIVNDIYAPDTLYPDLEIAHKLDVEPVQYFVECKYRSSWADGTIDISSQFLRYYFHAKHHNKELFIALGIGGTPSCPDEFYIVPARMIGYDKCISRDFFTPCLCSPTQDAYHTYINHYFNKRVFKTNL